MRRGGVSGSAGQSASASFSSSFELPVRLDEWPAREVARARKPWFYLRLGPEAGLTLVRVLRRGLELGECLGSTADRANENYDCPPHPCPGTGSCRRGDVPRRVAVPALARWRRQLGRIVALSFFPEPEREGRELAGERQARQFLPRAA